MCILVTPQVQKRVVKASVLLWISIGNVWEVLSVMVTKAVKHSIKIIQNILAGQRVLQVCQISSTLYHFITELFNVLSIQLNTCILYTYRIA